MKEATAWAILVMAIGTCLVIAIIGDNFYAAARDKIDAQVTTARNQNITDMVAAGADPIDAACGVAKTETKICLVRATAK